MILLSLSIEILNLKYIKLPELYTLEAHSDQKDIQRIKTAFDSLRHELSVLNYDNAVWDETFEYINNRNPDYTSVNFVLDTYLSLNISGIHIYDLHGATVWGKSFENTTGKIMTAPSFDIPSNKVLDNIINPAQHHDIKTNKPISHTGFIYVNKQLLYFAATLITRANLKTTPNGTMVFWRLFDESILANLQKRSGIKFTIELIPKDDTAPTLNTSKNSYSENSYRTKNGNIVDYYPLINSDKIIKFTYKSPPRLFETHWLNRSVIITFSSLSITLLIIYIFIHLIIVSPIVKAKTLVKASIENNNHLINFGHSRTDELGKLFYFIDLLLENINSKEQELISHNLSLQEISFTDGLTNIANRRAFDHYMKNLLVNSPKGNTVTMLVCDVDYFKKYNDFYGHAMGDKALKLIAENLQPNLHSETDFVARYGGEEFVILLNNTNELQATAVTTNLLNCIRSLNISHKKSDIADVVTLSIGSHTFIASEYDEYNSIFEQADKSLYLAKNLGRNRTCFSSMLAQFSAN